MTMLFKLNTRESPVGVPQKVGGREVESRPLSNQLSIVFSLSKMFGPASVFPGGLEMLRGEGISWYNGGFTLVPKLWTCL